MADLPFLRGQQSVLRFFSSGNEVVLNAKSWKVSENVTKINDPVCGEDRDRLDRVLNFFEFSAECYSRDMKQLDAFLADIANDDTGVAPLVKGGGVRVAPRDGSRKAYMATEISWDTVDVSASGRADRVMSTLTFRARYFKPASAA